MGPIDRYLAHLQLERRVSPHTLESYGGDLLKLAEFAAGAGRTVEGLDLHALEAFVRALMAEGRSPRSVARLVAAVRGFYAFLVRHGTLAASPAGDLQAPRAWKALPRFLTPEEVDRLLATPDVSTARSRASRTCV